MGSMFVKLISKSIFYIFSTADRVSQKRVFNAISHILHSSNVSSMFPMFPIFGTDIAMGFNQCDP